MPGESLFHLAFPANLECGGLFTLSFEGPPLFDCTPAGKL
jgi:hypothetical protein